LPCWKRNGLRGFNKNPGKLVAENWLNLKCAYFANKSHNHLPIPKVVQSSNLSIIHFYAQTCSKKEYYPPLRFINFSNEIHDAREELAFTAYTSVNEELT
jgi:hypothetical protein